MAETNAIVRAFTWTEEGAAPNTTAPLYKALTVPRDELSGSTVTATHSFERTNNPAEAEVFVAPLTWDAYARAKTLGKLRALSDVAREHRKPLLVWLGTGDDDVLTGIDNAILVHLSFESTERPEQLAAMPAMIGDRLIDHWPHPWMPIRWSSAPLVGFCGQSAGRRFTKPVRVWRNLKRRVPGLLPGARRYLPQAGTLDAIALRARVLNMLEHDDRIDTRFIRRNRYHAGVPLSERRNLKEPRKLEYQENIATTAYTVCIRGDGNFSIRFYEALCHGRTPILIDTECVLPLQELIDWDRYIVRVPIAKVNAVADRLLEFNARFDDASFAQHQKDCRAMWKEYLRPEVFYIQFARQLRALSAAGLSTF